MQKIAFFINPKIRNFRSIEIELQHHFIDLDYQFFISEYHGHLLTLPQKAISEGFNYLIAGQRHLYYFQILLFYLYHLL